MNGAKISGWSRGWAWAVGVLLVCHVASSLKTYPNYLAYSNELWGGPSQTYHYLTDSNTDWGQQLLAVKKYTDEHHITDCWFAYFVNPFLDASDYGIPCKPLPTPDTYFTKTPRPVPATITGPVFISAGTLTGFEFGSSGLNPYRDFARLKPVASIQDGVEVYEGTFHVPLASAMSYVAEAQTLLRKKDVAGALAQAQQAAAIAPNEFYPEMVLGDALAAAGQKDQALAAYVRALDAVKRMDRDAQEKLGPEVEGKMGRM